MYYLLKLVIDNTDVSEVQAVLTRILVEGKEKDLAIKHVARLMQNDECDFVDYYEAGMYGCIEPSQMKLPKGATVEVEYHAE